MGNKEKYDDYTNIKKIPNNIFFIAACNPYQMKSIVSDKEDDVLKVHPRMENLLSHRVFPIPPRMLNDLWDYGSLNDEVENDYINSMIGKLKLIQKFQDCFVKIITFCHSYIKKTVEKQKSSVSLRDVKRVVRIFKFYYIYIMFREKIEKDSKDENYEPINFQKFLSKHMKKSCRKITEKQFIVAFVITILINYVFRIAKEGMQNTKIILKKRTKERSQRKYQKNSKIESNHKSF